MSDAEIRALERQVQAGDPAAQARLETAWIRAGRGWHGEELSETEAGVLGAVGTPGRGVYWWYPRNQSGPGALVPLLEMVYVPGGEVQVPFFEHATGNEFAHVVKIPPFYISRYPIQEIEWRDFNRSRGLLSIDYSIGKDNHRPITNVSRADALAFCEWAGLRLPTAQEWSWAALGAPILVKRCSKPDEHRGACDEREVLEPRRFPWGNESPSQERCVWAGVFPLRPAAFRDPRSGALEQTPGSTAPVVVPAGPGSARCTNGHEIPPRKGGQHTNGRTVCRTCENAGTRYQVTWRQGELVPARPLGQSWCHAHDMVGNVASWVAEPGIRCGISFRTPIDDRYDAFMHGLVASADSVAHGTDDAGFRVALSAS